MTIKIFEIDDKIIAAGNVDNAYIIIKESQYKTSSDMHIDIKSFVRDKDSLRIMFAKLPKAKAMMCTTMVGMGNSLTYRGYYISRTEFNLWMAI